MQGANKLYDLFNKPQQIDKFYVLPGQHARGKTFKIYLLLEGVKANIQYIGNPPINKDIVEIFGVTSGNPGWDEKYGWLHEGKWVEDFYNIIKRKEKEMKERANACLEMRLERALKEKSRIANLLSRY